MTLLEEIRATPNLLTLLRLFLIPFLVINLLGHHNGLALTLFVLAGVSDALDGQIARRWGQSTKLGQYLDPIADKLLLSTLFLTVTHMRLVPQYVTVLVFARDLGILLISTLLYVTNTMRDFRPSILGKLNTLLQLATVLLVLVEAVHASEPWWTLRGWMLAGVAWLAPLSAAQYAVIVMRTVSADEPDGAAGASMVSPAGVSADSTLLPGGDAAELQRGKFKRTGG